MAIETEYLHDNHQPQASLTSSWSFPSYKQRSESEEVPISQILDHGSISFGRYATESLAWEKWSVFSHNRCQEELEKFKAPGLVAQKKAYFEEYYRKIRVMKALQAQQQETAQPDSCQDATSSSREVESEANVMVSQEEKNPSNVSQVLNSGSSVISNLNSCSGETVDESEQAAEQREIYCDNETSTMEKMNRPLPTTAKKASPLQTPSRQSAKSTQKNSSVSNVVSKNANQLKKHGLVLQAKGTVASIRNKTNLDSSRSTINNVKRSAKPNSTLHRMSIHKDDKIRFTSMNSDPKSASNSNSKITEVRSTATVLNSSLTKDKPVPPLSSTRTRQLTPNTTSKGLYVKLPTRSSVHGQSGKLVSSSSSTRACQIKASTTSQSLVEKSPSRLAVHSQSDKSISEKTTVTGSLRTTALSKRSVALSVQKKSSQKIGVESRQRNNVKEGIQNEGEDKLSDLLETKPKAALSAILKKDSNAALKREPTAASSARLKKYSNAAIGRKPLAVLSAGPRKDSKSASSMVSNVPQAQKTKLTQKIVPCRSPDMIIEPTQPRLKPIWR